MTHRCTWSLEGVVQLSEAAYTKFGREDWIITIRLEKSFLTLFVHEATLFPIAKSLEPGDVIAATGEIIPKNGEANKPQFLNPMTLKKING